jgi:hypothetical protein
MHSPLKHGSARKIDRSERLAALDRTREDI